MKTMKRSTVIIILTLLILILLTACRTSKRDKVNITQSENVVQDLNSYFVAQTNLQTEIKSILEKVLSESLDFTKKETEYDTEKPVLPETGKPPIRKETEANLTQKKEGKTHLNKTKLTTRTENSELADHVAINTSIDRSIDTTSEKNIQKESDIFLKWVGGIAISLVILILILYILGRYLKKRLRNSL